MKLLLDENVPRKLKFRLSQFQVFTVQEMGWSGQNNGLLLSSMQTSNFEALLTFDSNLVYQQNFKNYPIPVIVLSAKSNTYEDILPLLNPLVELLMSGNLNSGVNVVTQA
jgi:hypothetical protein